VDYRKVTVEVKIKLLIHADDDFPIENVMDDMEYDFRSCSDKADIMETEILDYTVTDSR